MTAATEQPSLSHFANTAILAGSGKLPEMLAAEIVRRGQTPVIVGIGREAGTWIEAYPNFPVETVEIGRLVRELKLRGVSNIVMAGGVRSRPDLSAVRPDWLTLRSLPLILRALRSGDDSLLRAFMSVMQRNGFRVLGAHEILPDLLAPAGCMTKARPGKADRESIQHAVEAALLLGKLDIGQAVVAVGGRVIALEGAEGTAAMLARVAGLRRDGRITAKKGGVLVKMSKPIQDVRADLPSIGPETIEQIAEAGLSGIAVSAGSSLILGFDETIKSANRLGMFVAGLNEAGPP